MYRVALCEDETFLIKSQEKACREVLEKLNIEHEISSFESSEAFWASFLAGARYDLMLFDIVMGRTNGMDLARAVRKYDSESAIVFITANPDFALHGYDVFALHYLIKPLEIETLEELISSDYELRFRRDFFIVPGEGMRIPGKEIICFETSGRRVLITTSKKTVEYSGKLSDTLESLPQNFIRCHVGYIINLRNIRKLTRTEAVAVNDKKIPISRFYSESAQKAFLRQLLDT